MRLCAIFLTTAFLGGAATDSSGDWPVYGHDPGGQRFSPLTAINRKNVGTLKVAWTYRTGDAYQPKNGRPTAFEATPLYINGTLYLSTPLGRVIALDPLTGKQRWSYDPKVDRDKGYGDFANRGVSAWTSHRGQLRILVATVDARLIAVDATTGKPAKDWSIIVTDPARNLVFVPTGSASPDYYGGERIGDNLFANSIVALRADTGKRVWHFQTVHHDLWDYDVASPPVLFDVRRNGATIPAVGVGSKTGNFFILNRETGQPIFGVEERAVPKTDVSGEVSSSTQPFPLAPRPLVPQTLGTDDIWGVDDADRAACRAEIGKLRSEGIFTPPS